MESAKDPPSDSLVCNKDDSLLKTANIQSAENSNAWEMAVMSKSNKPKDKVKSTVLEGPRRKKHQSTKEKVQTVVDLFDALDSIEKACFFHCILPHMKTTDLDNLKFSISLNRNADFSTCKKESELGKKGEDIKKEEDTKKETQNSKKQTIDAETDTKTLVLKLTKCTTKVTKTRHTASDLELSDEEDGLELMEESAVTQVQTAKKEPKTNLKKSPRNTAKERNIKETHEKETKTTVRKSPRIKVKTSYSGTDREQTSGEPSNDEPIHTTQVASPVKESANVKLNPQKRTKTEPRKRKTGSKKAKIQKCSGGNENDDLEGNSEHLEEEEKDPDVLQLRERTSINFAEDDVSTDTNDFYNDDDDDDDYDPLKDKKEIKSKTPRKQEPIVKSELCDENNKDDPVAETAISTHRDSPEKPSIEFVYTVDHPKQSESQLNESVEKQIRYQKSNKHPVRNYLGQVMSNLICKHCGVYRKTAAQLEYHITREHMQRRYQCETCGRKFLSAHTLKGHYKVSHATEGPTHPVYGEKCEAAEEVKVHQMHKTPPRYQCPVCTRTFQLFRSLQRHVLCHSKTYSPQHNIRLVTVASQAEAGHGGNPDNAVIVTKLVKDVMGDESGKVAQSIDMDVSSAYTCGLCGEAFNSREELWSHQKQHTLPGI